MLLNQETKDKFGYSVESLSQGSSKKICLRCDYCQGVYESTYKQYNKAHDVIDKDACIKCKYQKRKDISLKLYGVENSAQRPDVRKKISEKCEGFDEKRKKTMVKRYGTSNPMLNNDLKRKQQQWVQDKYGVENVSQLPEVKEKREQTNLQKFGHRQFFASEEGRQKKIDGMMTKYGVTNAFQADEVKAKIRQTSMEKYGFDHHLKDGDRAAQNTEKVIQSKINNGTIKLYDGKPISEWLKNSEYSDSRFRVLVNKYGIDIARTMSPKFSALEQIFEKWLTEQNISHKKQFAIGNKFADFYLPEYNIVIELDGLYWHSELEKEDDYHINKHFLYTSMGYKPFFFREDEIYNKFDIITSIVNNAANKSIRIFARKCDIVKLVKTEANTFFDNNHLMGKGSGTTYALKYGDKIVSAMIIKRLRNNQYEISRFCHYCGYQVIGGFSRLVKHFLRENSVDSLTTFIDRRYGSGDYLENLGFKFIRCEKSFRWTNSIECVHRLKFSGNGGYEKGFYKIWDCGQARYDLCVKS